MQNEQKLFFHKITTCSKSPNNTGVGKVRKNEIAPSQIFLWKFKVYTRLMKHPVYSYFHKYDNYSTKKQS